MQKQLPPFLTNLSWLVGYGLYWWVILIYAMQKAKRLNALGMLAYLGIKQS